MRAPYLDEAIAFLAKDVRLGPVVAACPAPGFEIAEDHYREMARAIVFQQLSGKAASTIWGRFEALVEAIEPARVLAQSLEELRAVGLSRQKASYLHDLSSRVQKDELRLSELEQMSDDEVRSELTQVKGFGPWCADMHLMFALGRPDVLALGDLGIRKGILKLAAKDSMAPQEMEEFAEPWRPFRSAACHYLWRSLE